MKQTIKKLYILLLFWGGIFVFPFSTYAQQDDALVSKDILFSLSPAYPGPREEVHVSAKTYSFDINTVSLSWYVNGKLVTSGKGITEITVTTGSIGTPTTIQVTERPPTGTRYDKTLTLWPSDLEVLWHANTYTPPGYRGKALPVRGSTITYTALPLMAAETGYYDLKTLLYEWHPLQGPLYQHALGDTFRVGSGGETRILAEPYYTSGKPSFLRYQWNIDNTNIASDTDRPEILSYLTEAGSKAQQRIAIEITNPFNILEQIRKSFRMYVE